MTVTEGGQPGCTFYTVLFVAPTESSCVLVGWLVGGGGGGGRGVGGLISFFPSLTREGKANADPGAGVYSCRNGKVVTFPPVLSVRRVDADSEDSAGTADKQQEPIRQPVVFIVTE